MHKFKGIRKEITTLTGHLHSNYYERHGFQCKEHNNSLLRYLYNNSKLTVLVTTVLHSYY